MNRLAEKILPIMNDHEVQGLVLDHYQSESQTLTSGAEENLLKFREINGWLSDADQIRWEEIKKVFRRNQIMGQANPADPVGRIVSQLAVFAEALQEIQQTLQGRFESLAPLPDLTSLSAPLKEIQNTLANELPQALASAASNASLTRLQTEIAPLKQNLSILRQILKRYESDRTQTSPIETSDQHIDLSGISITRNTLNQIYQLIEKDEKHIQSAKNRPPAKDQTLKQSSHS